MWDNAAALNRTAGMLHGAAALLIVYGCIHYVVHLPVFPLREIRVVGDVGHVTNEQVAAVIARELRGNFFTVDLAHAREAFEKLPWVRKVNVRRQWPDRLEVAVEEHRPLARWGSTALVNAHGEVFEAAISSTLPVFFGPDGTAAEVVARYAEFDRLLAPIGRKVVLITLSARARGNCIWTTDWYCSSDAKTWKRGSRASYRHTGAPWHGCRNRLRTWTCATAMDLPCAPRN
jgi:cell division protein FtsQ